MKLGKEALDALRAEVTGRLRAGDELVVAGHVALKGTSLLANHGQETLCKRFSTGFLQKLLSLYSDYNVGDSPQECEAWKSAESAGASAIYAMGEGGFLTALWKMAEASGVGFWVDYRKVPVRQETIELCEVFDLNPYRLFAEGALLIGIEKGSDLVHKLGEQGITAAVIGRVNEENDRLLYCGQRARYLERPAKDEMYKIIYE